MDGNTKLPNASTLKQYFLSTNSFVPRCRSFLSDPSWMLLSFIIPDKGSTYAFGRISRLVTLVDFPSWTC